MKNVQWSEKCRGTSSTRKAQYFLLILFCYCFSAFGAEPAGMACIKEMMVPDYTAVARRSPTGGTIKATISIGRNGEADRVDTSGSDPDLADVVRGYLSKAATYSTGCQGKQVHLVFTFRLEGAPELTPPVFFAFRPPNHFVIISRPQKAIAN